MCSAQSNLSHDSECHSSKSLKELNLLSAESWFPKNQCLPPVASKCIFFCALDTMLANGAHCPPRQEFDFKLLQGHSCSTTEFCEPSGCFTEGELEAAVAQIRGRDERGMVVRQKSRGEFPSTKCWWCSVPPEPLCTLPLLRDYRTFCAAAEPAKSQNANQNPTQAAEIFRGFYKTNFNNPFKCFFRLKHEFAKSRVAYSS